MNLRQSHLEGTSLSMLENEFRIRVQIPMRTNSGHYNCSFLISHWFIPIIYKNHLFGVQWFIHVRVDFLRIFHNMDDFTCFSELFKFVKLLL